MTKMVTSFETTWHLGRRHELRRLVQHRGAEAALDELLTHVYRNCGKLRITQGEFGLVHKDIVASCADIIRQRRMQITGGESHMCVAAWVVSAAVAALAPSLNFCGRAAKNSHHPSNNPDQA